MVISVIKRSQCSWRPWLDADDLGLGEQLANVGDGQAVEQVHQDHDGHEDEEDEEGEGEEGEGPVVVNGQVGELKFADKHGESLEDAGPQSVKVFHPVFIFKVGVLENRGVNKIAAARLCTS